MRITIKTLALALSVMLGTIAVAHAEKPQAVKVSKAKVDWKQGEQIALEPQEESEESHDGGDPFQGWPAAD